ncbi:MAG TPA: FAD-binding oxidoreductase [Gallionellaceae bacterium]
MPRDLIETLRQLAGTDNVRTGAEAASSYRDQRGNYEGNALAAVFPADTQQVSAVVSLCAQHQVTIVPQGGNTSLCGASVPLAEGGLQIVLNLSRMNKIRSIDVANYTMIVEAGCILADIRDAALQNNRLFPLGLTAIQSRCEIGGNLSTNAGGIGVLRYGSARDLILGLEVVLPDGRIWDGLRSLRKDNTGYDLKQLFIGAEGTLGIITAAVLKLSPRPRSLATACIAVRDPATAVAFMAHLRASCGDRISAFEIIGRSCLDIVFRHIPDTVEPFSRRHEWLVITELSDPLETPLDQALQAAIASFPGGLDEYAVTTDARRAENWWKLRKAISDAQKLEGVSVKHDISIPISEVPAFLQQADAALTKAYPGVRIVAFGHIGDGNIHYNASLPDAEANRAFFAQSENVNRIVYDITARLGGSIAAEHGLGQLKRAQIRHYKSALEMELMERLKQAIDPQGLLNPGKVL